MNKKDNPFIHNPETAEYIHCIGIGGIGVSAIARYFLENGRVVSGSDVVESDVTRSFKKNEVHICIGSHKAKNIPSHTQVVIFSPAVPESNPEREAARKYGIVEVSYPEMIGHIMLNKFGITISGTHGKTTTTALLGHVLIRAKLDPTVIVGSFVKDFNGRNEHLGKGDYMVVEGDEYKASFLNYKPKMIVLTTIDEDHLDYYRDINHIKAVFQEYLLRLPSNGVVIANADDPHTLDVLSGIKDLRVVQYGEHAEYSFSDVSYGRTSSSCVVHHEGSFERLEIPLLGKHNIYNALAVYACARTLGIPGDSIARSIKTFKGVWRRFDVRGSKKGITIIDDYAHHPTEIRALISALRQSYDGRRILFVYQPHQQDRFMKLFDQFTHSFAGIDKLYLAEIYSVEGRSGKDDTSKRLVKPLQEQNISVTFSSTFSSLEKKLLQEVQKDDVIVFVGAGNITTLRAHFEEAIQKQ
ncbi:MAG: UDP-N-acetylmuramate--L-alanine ligase [Patescibacteria group bacterium]|jgi:UDP-N-acetylmuramate--alanine ligase